MFKYDNMYADSRVQVSVIYSSIFEEVNKPKPKSAALLTVKLCAGVCAVACIFAATKTYISDGNIHCVTGHDSNEDKQEVHAIETYCFVSSTYTLLNLSEPSPHPGVGPGGKQEDHTRHAYYQWVPFTLALQAAVHVLPLVLWSLLDNGYFQDVLFDLDKVFTGEELDNPESTLHQHTDNLAKYFAATINHHIGYGLSFLACEMLAFLISLGNLFFTNLFLGGQFLKYGVSALSFLSLNSTDPNNPLNEVFPKVTKCTFYKYGPSGTLETLDAMCVLPINIMNEKIYLVLWLVFVAATLLCGLVLLLNLFFLVPVVRNAFLMHQTRSSGVKQSLVLILPKCNYGDWFLMLHLKYNMVNVNYSLWLKKLHEELQK